MMTTALRVALAIGALIDFGVALLCFFGQSLFQTLLDVPLHDPAIAVIAGGEYLVVTFVYVLALRDPVRFRPLLWLCALDQLLAIVLPLAAIGLGQVPATWKTVGPMPFQAILVVIYLLGLRSHARPSTGSG
jgi:hypothetical protein